mmetsp:Transcript_17835/g.45243  ORF Transcript_17835/g.45243 Transcript_17835/m.45243 type:complete len:298 (-) Transcript_17835:168-1061(-)|eukprot:jgi/Tetstr1/426294/TSEL_016611.t1
MTPLLAAAAPCWAPPTCPRASSTVRRQRAGAAAPAPGWSPRQGGEAGSGASRQRRAAIPLAECAQSVAAALPQVTTFQAGVQSLSLLLESAHPVMYLFYFLLAGCGIPFSEDAMVVWIAANVFRGVYESGQMAAFALMMAYVGVTASDMISYGIGKQLQNGMAPWLKEKLMGPTFDRATSAINKFGTSVGAVQRFILGFRWPLCVIAGFSNVKQGAFFMGVCAGALGSMSLQVSLGYLLRDNPSPYLTTLALVAGPQVCGQILGPLVTGVGLLLAGRKKEEPSTPPAPSPPSPTATL